MDSSPVLCQQSQNKIHGAHMRMKNEQNKMPGNPSKHLSVPNISKQDLENRDPGNIEKIPKSPARPGVSRLPVLAKSLKLQTPNDFTQSHKRWEAKPLAGKAKTKKPCTKPVPFNFSQPKNTRRAPEYQRPLNVVTSRTGNRTNQAVNILHIAHLKGNGTKAQVLAPKPLSTKLAVDLMSPVSAVQHLARASHSAVPEPNGELSQAGADACSNNLERLSLKDPSTNLNTSQNMLDHDCISLSAGLGGKEKVFQIDHAAFLSILRNEGVGAVGLGSATPPTKPYKYLPQRVSLMKKVQKAAPISVNIEGSQPVNEGVTTMGQECATPQSTNYNYLPQRASLMKSRQKAGPTSGATNMVQFSPDPTAMRCILEDQGVKVQGRGTSIYSAQRVPVKKSLIEMTGGPAGTPVMKWTPQRVPDTQHRHMSSMASAHKRLLSAHRTPYASSSRLGGHLVCNMGLEPHKEDVVQKLFGEVEEQSANVSDKDHCTREEKCFVQTSTGVIGRGKKQEEREEEEEEEEEQEEQEKQEQSQRGKKSDDVQPFIQEQHRESVIFFSTGKKLLRAPCVEKLSRLEQHGVAPATRGLVVPEREGNPPATRPTGQGNAVQSVQPDFLAHRTCALSPAVVLLRRRLPPLEELRLDEEVATYTSLPAVARQAFEPHVPRFGNPLVSILHFQESTSFVPVRVDPSSGPSSPCSSPLRER